ncbi:hypothetical protein [Chitinophaga sp. S165]|uniref:hypothetical protein n=1 Tax=Chitinophaga sp. S165 TaxID=2135462 RepID=UPI0013049C04|nr:hypothetical protein [Chitinophaga sp. S165]
MLLKKSKLVKMPDKSNQDQQKRTDQETNDQKTEGQQPIDERAERYIKEAGNIEDVPDADDQEEAEDKMEKH